LTFFYPGCPLQLARRKTIGASHVHLTLRWITDALGRSVSTVTRGWNTATPRGLKTAGTRLAEINSAPRQE
jgi:hypothetical protein